MIPLRSKHNQIQPFKRMYNQSFVDTVCGLPKSQANKIDFIIGSTPLDI